MRAPWTCRVLLAVAMTAAPLSPLPIAASSADVGSRTFYVSANGSDSADGRTPTTAWRSLNPVNRRTWLAGDRLLLQGGQRYAGPLQLDSADAGSATRPLVIGSYGGGRASIVATSIPGIDIYNTAGVDIRDLTVVGGTTTYRTAVGISLYNDLPGDRKLDHVRISGVDVSGFKIGLAVGGGRGASGFRNVAISAATLHDNLESGLATYGPEFSATTPTYAHDAVTVTGVEAFRNVGDPDNAVRNTGSGIILGSVRGGLVRSSSAHDNGERASAPEGPVGIWTYDSTRVVLERNVSYRNRSSSGADGGGFDLDQNVSDSTMQYNLSYANDGYGYLVWTARDNAAHARNTVRYNISSHDVRHPRSGWYGAITVHGRISGTRVYRNTVVVAAGVGTRPPALRLGGALSDVTVRDNVLYSDGAGPVVVSDRGSVGVTLQNNSYHRARLPWQVVWGASTYGSLSSWRAASGQEVLQGRATGFSGDPGLVNSSTPLAVVNPADRAGAGALRLRAGSPLVHRGLDLRELFGTDPGPLDFFGTAGSVPSVGADSAASS